MHFISNSIVIRQATVSVNGAPYYRGQPSEFKDFAKELYQHLGITYPKFYKMDNLCKLAFLASEIVLKELDGEDIALIFSSKEGSLDTDIQHQGHIQDENSFYPSPATFVYTLPNICIGEVSIRHQLKTESMFLLAEAYQTAYIQAYSDFLIESGKAKKVLCGWLRMLKDDYVAQFYLVEKQGNIAHQINNIEQILNK